MTRCNYEDHDGRCDHAAIHAALGAHPTLDAERCAEHQDAVQLTPTELSRQRSPEFYGIDPEGTGVDDVAAIHNARRDQDALRRAREAVAAEQERRADENHQAHITEAVRRQREALAATEALGRAVHLTITRPQDFPTNESLADEAEQHHLDEQAKLKAISTPQPLPTFVDEILCAEKLLAAAGDTRNDVARANAFQAAQVHATLAVAKAVAELGLEL